MLYNLYAVAYSIQEVSMNSTLGYIIVFIAQAFLNRCAMHIKYIAHYFWCV